MSFTKSVQEAEQLWQRLQSATAEAWSAGDWSRARRIEETSERAFWRLVRRMGESHERRRRHETSTQDKTLRKNRVARVG